MTMIPRTIHQYWTGGTYPAEFAAYTERWKALHPGWVVMMWDDELLRTMKPLQNRDLFERATLISPGAPHQFKSDVLRYELLWRFGGVWLDVDFAPQKSLDDLCDVDCWACWEVPDQWINNAVIGATSHHPMIKDLMDKLPASIRACSPRDGNTLKSGPQYITPILRERIAVYPREYFFPYGWDELRRETESFPDAYAIHRWNHRRSMR